MTGFGISRNIFTLKEGCTVEGFTRFMGQDYVFWPLVAVFVILIVVFVVMRMKGDKDED